MKRLLVSVIIALAAAALGAQAGYAQSGTPTLEEVVYIGTPVQYSVTATGGNVTAYAPVSVTCNAGGKLLGVAMSKDITLPAWTGTSYWSVGISTSFDPNAVVYSETSEGGRTVTIASTIHAREWIITNWSVLSGDKITPADLSTATGLPFGQNIPLPWHYVDYSVPAVTPVTGVAQVSANYVASNGGLPMVVTGEIVPICITDPSWYYVGPMKYITANIPGTGNTTTNVGLSFNGPENRVAGFLSDSRDTLLETQETNHSINYKLTFSNGVWGFLYEKGWYETGGGTSPDDRKYCITRFEGEDDLKIWELEGYTIYVQPCLIPEASGYAMRSSVNQYWLRVNGDLTVWSDYTWTTLEIAAVNLMGDFRVAMRPILIGAAPQPTGTCADNFQLAGTIKTDSVPAYDASPFLTGGQYGEAIGGLESGKYYAVEIVDPAWQQGDSHPPANSYLSQLTTQWQPGPYGEAAWFDPAQLPNACAQDLGLGRMRVYFYVDQTDYAPLYGIRAKDPAGNWENNIGDLNYTIYNAVYTPTPSACEAKWEIGNLVGSNIQIRADRSDGGYVNPGLGHPWQPNQTYMVEISGEPWYDDGTIPSHAIEVSIDDGTTWVDIDDLTGEFCVADTGFGMRRWYLTHQTGRLYKFRAKDPNNTYLQNSGYISYSVYTATNFETNGPCNQTFTIGTELVNNYVAANLEDGGEIPLVFTKDTWYVVETLFPPWYEASTERGDADYSGANYSGREFVGLLDFPSASCSETTGIYQRMYYRAQYDKYWIRAAGSDQSWANHTGQLHYRVLEASLTNPNDPPPASCEENYNQQRVLLSVHKIISSNSYGVDLTSLPEGLYAVETLDGPWFDNQELSYDVRYADDEFAVRMHPLYYSSPVECSVLLSDQKHTRSYINVTHGEADVSETIAVYDGNGNWTDNTGSISIAIYKVTNANEPPPMPEPPPATTCNGVCVRPDGVLDVPAWLEYGRCTFSKFISFCPYHAAALESSIDAFNTREPFKTFQEIATLPQTIKDEFDVYTWDNPSGGGENLQKPTGLAAAWYDILPNLPADSPWNNGKIVIMKPMSTEYSTMCNVELTQVIGTRLGKGVCFMLNIMNGIGAIKWMQFILDLVMLVILGLYISQGWLKQGG